MSLPPGFLEELRDRVPLSQVVGRKVSWDRRKSNQARGDWWAPCPFHQEKTASFHVDDRKGFFYCFGCHAKGDAISFLRESENMDFMEAVAALAQEAGMEMPARDPQAAERADQRTRLAEVMEQAVRFFRLQLNTAAAAEARDYLARRGLDAGAQGRFEIGYAPEGRQALYRHLSEAGVERELILEAGLAAAPDGGGAPYDRFSGRIIFPIRDARGRAIAFGGRALRADARAKYLNSPQTELFDKSRSLYNHGPARAAAGKGHELIVAEGYMDVIALVEAGFEAAVAPLGTAITEDQLRLLWRIAPEPVIALDGDSAGLRAGQRLADLALPLIEAGQSLRFCIMPEGQDPDDVLRAGGAAAMRQLINDAEPMARLLWRRETDGAVLDSPERRAALDKRLRALLGRIRDPSLRSHYGEEFRRLRAELFDAAAGPAGRRGGSARSRPADFRKGNFAPAPMAPLPATRSTVLGSAGSGDVAERMHEEVILAILAAHPGLIPRFEEALERIDFTAPERRTLRDALLSAADADGSAARREKIAERAGDALEKLMSLRHVRFAPPVRKTGDEELARMCLAEEIAKLDVRRGVEMEIRDAVEEIAGMADEGLTWRLGQAAAARHRVEQSRLEDSGDLGEDRTALSESIQSLIDDEVWVKKRR
ncbi:DNA primase [Rhodobacteraceae bacterium WD3A24]|nr:DNA primase [Rhodobacteraceae bacterium WD3A24]